MVYIFQNTYYFHYIVCIATIEIFFEKSGSSPGRSRHPLFPSFPPFSPLFYPSSILDLPVTALTSHKLFRHHTAKQTKTHNDVMMLLMTMTWLMIRRFAKEHKLQWGHKSLASLFPHRDNSDDKYDDFNTVYCCNFVDT